MLKSVLAICFWAAIFFLGGVKGWSDDMEDRFIGGDIVSTKIVFIDVKDASLQNVLKIISQQSGLSFIASQDVADKKITVFLNKVPLNQALDLLLDANGLAYDMQEDSGVFVVKAKTGTAKNLITKVYHLKYATVSTSPLNTTIDTTDVGTSGSFESPSSSSGSEGASSGVISGGTVGGATKGANTGGLETELQNSLSPDGKVIEDARTNSLIVTDVPAQFEVIESTIAKLDVAIPQILIEVQMLDVSKVTADQLGITYGATPLSFQGGQKFSNFPFGVLDGLPPGSTESLTPPTTVTGWNANGLTAALNFLTTTTDARLLARPRILTLNNQSALIQISTNQIAGYTQTVTTSTTGPPITTYTPIRFATGVTLKVTPQADLSTGEITMAVEPKDTTLILATVQPPITSGLSNFYDPQTRGTDSLLKLKNGQSMMIGGLMNNQITDTVTKLPFLGDLPVVGAAFRSRNKNVDERELIIFLTPHIIDVANQSALKGDGSSNSPQAQDVQDASDHAQEINDSLNSYER